MSRLTFCFRTPGKANADSIADFFAARGCAITRPVTTGRHWHSIYITGTPEDVAEAKRRYQRMTFSVVLLAPQIGEGT